MDFQYNIKRAYIKKFITNKPIENTQAYLYIIHNHLGLLQLTLIKKEKLPTFTTKYNYKIMAITMRNEHIPVSLNKTEEEFINLCKTSHEIATQFPELLI